MSIEVCPSCTCRFAVGLLRCPQCGTDAPLFADRITTQEEPMPRITVAAGPSNAAARPGEPGYIAPAAVEEIAVETPPAVEAEAPASVAASPMAEPETADIDPVLIETTEAVTSKVAAK